ncbi:hypothetical protein [Desulfofustis limnaeus]|jgi:hypothetical protein|uniref:Lipoprotein n=1 Tax=Desulfofustis limnaeus TaxID=2740163 RepID=A0ABM7WDT1_9BACT|nr:hypothetical protein [Desulfofustis limnaeus]BDD89121.1 hypothetical protein DPPLL_34860 [Desulfofustis limnaeus]
MNMRSSLRPLALFALVVAAGFLTGCSSKQPLQFRVHTDPEGAHVIYRQDNLSWIYLGVTPLDVVEVVSDERLEEENTLSLKVMRCGYLDQEKQWTGEALVDEIEEKGEVFWTPRLIKNVE